MSAVLANGLARKARHNVTAQSRAICRTQAPDCVSEPVAEIENEKDGLARIVH